MKKIKVLSFFILISTFLFVSFDSASAVAAGCYKKDTNGDFVSITCPDENRARATSQFGACYVTDGGTTTERSCTDLTQDASVVPQSQSISSSDDNSGREALRTDCGADRIDKDNCQIVGYLVNGINFLFCSSWYGHCGLNNVLRLFVYDRTRQLRANRGG